MPQADTYTPETLDEVAALLLAADGQARPAVTRTAFLAAAKGPTGPMSIVVDVRRVPEMNRVEYDERNGLLVGAAVPWSEPLRFPPVRHAYAILADGVSLAGTGAARDDATLGQWLGNPAESADLALPLICLGASVAVFGPHGWSETTLEALCARGRGTALQPGEFLVDVRLPAPSPRSGGAYVRSASGEIDGDAVGAGAFLVMQDDLETCCGARLAVRADDAQPMRALDAERFLQGRRVDRAVVDMAGDLSAQLCGPPVRSRSADDRAGALRRAVCRAIVRALERARPGSEPDTDARRE
jgi:CO/xanthine dehydrogenase FAD-binding subunit